MVPDLRRHLLSPAGVRAAADRAERGRRPAQAHVRAAADRAEAGLVSRAPSAEVLCAATDRAERGRLNPVDWSSPERAARAAELAELYKKSLRRPAPVADRREIERAADRAEALSGFRVVLAERSRL